jgi:hypothetical protein
LSGWDRAVNAQVGLGVHFRTNPVLANQSGAGLVDTETAYWSDV